jgi:hypothetical protein
LNSASYYHPSKKQAVLKTLIHRARTICDKGSIDKELRFLTKTFKENGYNQGQIQRAISPAPKTVKVKEKPTALALLPYIQITFNQLTRLLGRHNIKCIAIPPTKISDFLPKIKDDLGLRTPGIYSIPCECGKVYIGQRVSLYKIELKNTNAIHVCLGRT